MKTLTLQPPSTAPKDDTFLAVLMLWGEYVTIQCVWDIKTKQFMTARTIEDGKECYFESTPIKPGQMRGWIKLPWFSRPEVEAARKTW